MPQLKLLAKIFGLIISDFGQVYKHKWKALWPFNPFFPWAAYLQMVISWSLRYSDTSFVVMILAKIEFPRGKPFSFVKIWDGVFLEYSKT